jgi:hypothetical protein
MSYSVRVKFKTTEGKPPWMRAADIVQLRDECDNLPESSFIDSAYQEAKAIVAAKVACATCKTGNDSDSLHCKKCGKALPTPPETAMKVELKKLYWSGRAVSAHPSDSLESVAPFIHGRLEAFFIGEDGDVFGGAILEDGKYTAMDVEMTLVPKKPRNPR